MANTTIKRLKESPERSSNKRESIASKETGDIIFSQSKKSFGMKRQIRKILTFFAFNLLLFAVYLNFIQKDKGETLPEAVQSTEFVKRDSRGGPIQESADQSRSLSLDGNKAAKTKVKPGYGDKGSK